MQNKVQQKKNIYVYIYIYILKTTFTEFSRKEKAITRSTRIYIKTKWQR